MVLRIVFRLDVDAVIVWFFEKGGGNSVAVIIAFSNYIKGIYFTTFIL
jgi:hypothetical protein